MKKEFNTQDLIQTHGKENLRFLVSMRPIQHAFGLFAYTNSNDPEEMQVCRIVEERYKLEENYKIELRSENSRYGKEKYYIHDLNQLIRDRVIRVFIEL